jgi:hypothetical protein
LIALLWLAFFLLTNNGYNTNRNTAHHQREQTKQQKKKNQLREISHFVVDRYLVTGTQQTNVERRQHELSHISQRDIHKINKKKRILTASTIATLVSFSSPLIKPLKQKRKLTIVSKLSVLAAVAVLTFYLPFVGVCLLASVFCMSVVALKVGGCVALMAVQVRLHVLFSFLY